MPRGPYRATEDAAYRHELGHPSNPLCPDHSAHSENAAERLYPRGIPKNADYELIDAEAEAEYMQCEGH
jgi:hypothetical protein